jgi:hypothetical protein
MLLPTMSKLGYGSGACCENADIIFFQHVLNSDASLGLLLKLQLDTRLGIAGCMLTALPELVHRRLLNTTIV